ncbi:hypothetical protein [Halopiger goleimassiliensis]|uniref:hypothetical protein n=1 Tax=Halopiger goleimassiliensis TaxID=1293048 RepID=UPI0009DC3997|nr:hypothetical protein [Halopiger goleimassiliensis]
MESPSDRRLLAMCVLSAGVGVAAYLGAEQYFDPSNGGVLALLVAIVAFAVLMFADGYVTSRGA